MTKLWLRQRFDAGEPGRHVTDEDYDVLLTGDAKVYKPNGDLLCIVRRGVLDIQMVKRSAKLLRPLRAARSMNRGVAAGGEREFKIRKSGVRSNTSEADPVASAVAGFYDRYPRIPYCRQTAFTADHPDAWKGLQPLFQRVSDVYRDEVPDRWASQMEHAEGTSPDFVVEGTPFTTFTVNHNWQTMMHTDRGDLIGEGKGFSVLTAFTNGAFRGGVLVIPAYRVAADLKSGDVILMDSHEFHGNTPFHSCREGWERISVVYYYRTKMLDCGTAAEEAARAKDARGSL